MIALLYLAFGIAGILAVRAYVGGLRRNVSNPFALGMVAFCVAYFLVPSLGYTTSAYRFQDEYALETHVIYLGTMALFYLSAFLVDLIAGGRRRYAAARARMTDLRKWRYINPAELLLIGAIVLIPGIASMLWVMRRISAYGYNEYVANRIVLNSGLGYMLMPIGWFSVFLVLLFANSQIRRANTMRRSSLTPILIVLLFCIGSALMMGSRSRALWPLLYLATAFIFLRGGPMLSSRRAIRIVALGLALLIVATVMRDVRHQISSGTAIGDLRLGVANSALESGILNAYGEYENVLWLLENQQRVEWLWGQTFVAAAVGAIPRSIWAEKPLGGGPHLRNMIHPGSYDLARGRGLTSYTTGLPAEAIMNFGPIGVVLIGAAYGMGLWAMTFLLGRISGSIAFTAWFFGLHRMIGVLSAEVFGTMSHLFAALVPLLMAVVLLRILRTKSYLPSYRGDWPSMLDPRP